MELETSEFPRLIDTANEHLQIFSNALQFIQALNYLGKNDDWRGWLNLKKPLDFLSDAVKKRFKPPHGLHAALELKKVSCT